MKYKSAEIRSMTLRGGSEAPARRLLGGGHDQEK
jgi:hypothetical protein